VGPPAPRRQPKGVHKKGKQLLFFLSSSDCFRVWQEAAMAPAPGTSFGRRTRAPSSRLLGQREGGPVAASAPCPATDLGWRSGALCTKTPAKGCAQEGQAAALAPDPGTSFGRRTRASNVRQQGRR